MGDGLPIGQVLYQGHSIIKKTFSIPECWCRLEVYKSIITGVKGSAHEITVNVRRAIVEPDIRGKAAKYQGKCVQVGTQLINLSLVYKELW